MMEAEARLFVSISVYFLNFLRKRGDYFHFMRTENGEKGAETDLSTKFCLCYLQMIRKASESRQLS